VATRANPRTSGTPMSSQFKRMVRAKGERSIERLRKELVLDLANLTDDARGLFRKRFAMFVHWDDGAILKFRDQLRMFWSGDDSYHADRPQYCRFGWLHSWLDQARKGQQPLWTVGTWADGTHSVTPNDSILPLALALAASELTPQMGICANPECPQKYFLKGRKTQRFCDRPLCSVYGQRQHKMKWWEAHKSELRPRPMSPKNQSRKNRR